MKFRIAMDSGGEIPEELKNDERYRSVPLTLTVNGFNIIDDGTMSQAELVRRIAEDPEVAKTACPSPQAYYDAFDCDAEHIYGLTLTGELSGSYQSAEIGKNMYLEDHPDAKIHVFNSCSASVGQTITLLKIKELEEKGLPFEEIIRVTEEFIREKHTYFVLDNLETLRKNGRLSAVKALAANVLKIKPVCMGTPEGVITQIDQARGVNKAIVKMVGHVCEKVKDPENLILGISHCNCPERARIVRDEILSRINVKDVLVLPTGGLSSIYANDGGIIVAI